MTATALDKKYLRPAMIIFSQNEPTQPTANITSISRTDSNTKIQYTTSSAHGFTVGDFVTISGATIGNFAFSTPQMITDVTTTSPHTFKIASTNNGTSGAAIATNQTRWELGTNYLYITDDGRDPVSVSVERIESRQRMANGRMRTYHITDKKSFSTGWTNLPSRANRYPTSEDGLSDQITSDGFGAGQDIKNWYETYVEDFWVLLVYDGASDTSAATSQVEKYNVFFESFDFTVSKRGQFNDLWDVNISLVEA
jgi:hypothetical protein